MPNTQGLRQQRTLAARQSFASPEEKSEYYRALGQKSAEGRLVLSDEDAQALADAYELLSRICANPRIAERLKWQEASGA
jgi:hypothetical protein